MLTENSLYLEDLELCLKDIPLRDGMSFYITGATGMIGSFLTEALLHYGKKKECKISVAAAGRSLERLSARFKPYLKNTALSFSVRDAAKDIPVTEHYDYIIHLAGIAEPALYGKYPIETIMTAIEGSARVLEYLKCHPNSRGVLVSTSKVYGDILAYEGCADASASQACSDTEGGETVAESDCGVIDYNVISACYPESMRVAELLLKGFCAQHDAKGIIARLDPVCGPTMRKNDTRNLSPNGCGCADTLCIYLADAAAGIMSALFFGDPGEAYNVAGAQSRLSIERAKTLGFAPAYSAKEANERTIRILKGES